MKTNAGTKSSLNKATSHQHCADNKDNLYSHKNEEFDTKGDDVTHNKKEYKNNHPKQQNDNKTDED